jgi:hypothetical protein
MHLHALAFQHKAQGVGNGRFIFNQKNGRWGHGVNILTRASTQHDRDTKATPQGIEQGQGL